MFKFFAALAFTFVTLLVLWCTAGSANAAEMSCHRQPLTQSAAPGETVLVCEGGLPAVRPMVRLARRAATTTIRHYGHRTPVYTITVLASR